MSPPCISFIKTNQLLSPEGTAKHLCFIGTGAWGKCLGQCLEKEGYSVNFWSPTQYKQIFFRPTIEKGCSTLRDFLKSKSIIFLAVSSPYVRKIAHQIAELKLTSPTIVLLSKGFEAETGYRLSEVVKDEVSDAEVCVLSGGSHAEEVALGLPYVMSAASENIKVAANIKELFRNTSARVSVTTDVVGTELCAALKNIIAIAVGISDGLGLGDNCRAALIMRGTEEISRIVAASGGDANTVLGPAGLADILATTLSQYSRNRRFGLAVSQGLNIQAGINKVGATVEGVNAIKNILHFSKQYEVELAFPRVLHSILEKEIPATEIKKLI